MGVRSRIAFWLLTAGCLVLTATGCPDSTPIGVDNGEFNFTLTADPLNNNFTNSAADRAQININAVTLLPVDPLLQQSVGSTETTVLQDAVVVNLKQPFMASIDQRIPAGTYRVERMLITGVSFNNADFAADPAFVSDPMNPTCNDFVLGYTTGSGVFSITADNIGEVIVEVSPDASSLMIDLDAQGFLAALQQAAPCSPSCSCPGNYDPNNQATWFCTCNVPQVNRGTLRTLAPTYLTIATN